MKKRIAVVIVVLLLVGAGVIFFSRRTDRDSANSIIVSGNIELTEVNIAFKTAGRLIERTVDEGDPVKKGR